MQQKKNYTGSWTAWYKLRSLSRHLFAPHFSVNTESRLLDRPCASSFQTDGGGVGPDLCQKSAALCWTASPLTKIYHLNKSASIQVSFSRSRNPFWPGSGLRECRQGRNRLSSTFGVFMIRKFSKIQKSACKSYGNMITYKSRESDTQSIRRSSQVVRRGSATPWFTGSNPVCAS